MRINVLTIFPEILDSALNRAIIGKALKNGIWSINLVNLRDFAKDKHKSVDDTVYGGGAGMLFKPDVLSSAIQSLSSSSNIFHLSPKGILLTQKKVIELSSFPEITLISSRYEGIDQRIIEKYNIREISIGDYVLTGGEIPALVVIDAIVRMLEGVVGNNESTQSDSFSDFLIEHDQFTKPENFDGHYVPKILLSGNHSQIAKHNWLNSLENTRKKRKDLWFKFIKHYLTK